MRASHSRQRPSCSRTRGRMRWRSRCDLIRFNVEILGENILLGCLGRCNGAGAELRRWMPRVIKKHERCSRCTLPAPARIAPITKVNAENQFWDSSAFPQNQTRGYRTCLGSLRSFYRRYCHVHSFCIRNCECLPHFGFLAAGTTGILVQLYSNYMSLTLCDTC
jgi:hypothetical protein